MIIMKFGGSSVKDAAAMRNVAEIITFNLNKNPLVVLSALGGVTDDLMGALQNAARRDLQAVELTLHNLRRRHETHIDELIEEDSVRADLKKIIGQELAKLKTLLAATGEIGVESGKLSHAILSVGELLSTYILNGYLNSKGIDCRWIDARKLIVIDSARPDIYPMEKEIAERCSLYLGPLLKTGSLVITQGFIATTQQGAPATLGRDGSDYTASLLGAALNAQEIQIWSDVDGILSADPSIIPYARPLKMMTFNEACELAYFGARILHPATIQPALARGIDVRVLNSRFPAEAGTLIRKQAETDSGRPIKSIAYKEGITLLTVESSRLLLSPKMIEEIFDILSRHGKRVYAVSKSATKLSVTIENSDDPGILLKDIEHYGQVTVEPEKVIVSVVGEDMRANPQLTWQIIRSLARAGIHLELISQFASEISLMFIIDESCIEDTVRLIHKDFIEDSE